MIHATTMLRSRRFCVAHPDIFKQGMRRLAAGVSIITTAEGGIPYGFAATSVTAVSLDPSPLLLACVNKSVSCHDVILRTNRFCVNVLRESDIQTAKLFSSSENRHRRFDLCEWKTLRTGMPALSNALVTFDCEIVREVEVQTHTVLFGKVEGVELHEGALHPLHYVNGQYDGIRSMSPAGA
jgi:flavin reductase